MRELIFVFLGRFGWPTFKPEVANYVDTKPPWYRRPRWRGVGKVLLCNRPPMRERSSRGSPSLGAGSSLWGERSGGGERAGGGVSPPSLRDGVGSNCKRAGPRAPPPLRPSLFVLAPIMAALGDIRTTLL